MGRKDSKSNSVLTGDYTIPMIMTNVAYYFLVTIATYLDQENMNSD